MKKNDYSIVDVYNDAGHYGKDLMKLEMQRLLADIKSKKIDKLIAIKVDRLTRNNYDSFWSLQFCEEHDVKIELILEPYDISTANGEMIFRLNLVFGQRERKEIGARTKRAMEEIMANKLTNHLVSVNIESENRLNILMEQYKNSNKLLSEKNKNYNRLKWIKLMNKYKNMAEEIILKELIYV